MRFIYLLLVLLVLAAGAAWYFLGQPSDTEGTVNYVGHSPEECSRIRFVCEEGLEYFADDSGCGCRSIQQQTPQTSAPVAYVCQGGRRLSVAYGEGIAEVTLEGTTTYTLELISADDETKYANEGDKVVLWVRDGSAFLEEDGATTFAACREQE